jgi:hypothetical protein
MTDVPTDPILPAIDESKTLRDRVRQLEAENADLNLFIARVAAKVGQPALDRGAVLFLVEEAMEFAVICEKHCLTHLEPRPGDFRACLELLREQANQLELRKFFARLPREVVQAGIIDYRKVVKRILQEDLGKLLEDRGKLSRQVPKWQRVVKLAIVRLCETMETRLAELSVDGIVDDIDDMHRRQQLTFRAG